MLCQNNTDVNTNTNKFLMHSLFCISDFLCLVYSSYRFFMLRLFLTGDSLCLASSLEEIYNAQ